MKKKTVTVTELSKCHKYPVEVSKGDEGTNSYYCLKCKKPCDLYTPSSKKATPKVKKVYTVSTFVFNSLAEAEAQLRKWDSEGDLYRGTKVFECTGKVYEPKLKLVETKYDTPNKK